MDTELLYNLCKKTCSDTMGQVGLVRLIFTEVFAHVYLRKN